MNLKNKIFLFFLLIPFISNAQSGVWTWMKGDSITGIYTATYGTQGIPGPNVNPSGDYQTTYWTDNQGNLWMYTGTYGATNDLWKFNVNLNNWTWMNGNQSSALNYGVKGIPSPNNYPGTRLFGTNCWVDNNNNLWMYSGTYMSPDLWKYNIASNEWTWMQGQDLIGGFYNYPPVYGTIGVESPTNTPGDRQECKSGWTSSDNKLWMFGGGGNSTNVNNQIWRYNIATNQWAWIKGDTIASQPAAYGIKGVESSNNKPDGRLSYSRWISKSGDFFILGGDAYDSSSIVSGFRKNDVWRYRPSTNNWTWISGDDTTLGQAVYPGYCIQEKNAQPQNRFEFNAITANDCNKTSWLFGGYSNNHTLNDLWTFNTENFEWTLVKGNPNVTDYNYNHGTKGVPSVSNIISGRGGTAMWTDKDNNIWIYGGYAINRDTLLMPVDVSNSLWKFVPDYNCINVVQGSNESISPPTDTLICHGDTTGVFYQDTIITSIQPSNAYTYLAGASQNYLFHPTTTTAFTVNYTSICQGPKTLIFTITVLPKPIADFEFNKAIYELNDANIILNNTSKNSSIYSWYTNSLLISILPNPTFPIDSVRQYCYTLKAENTESCYDTTTKCTNVVRTLTDDIFIPSAFSPNADGLNDYFKVISNTIFNFNLRIYNRWGQEVTQLNVISDTWDGSFKTRKCEMGTYYYVMQYKNLLSENKLLKGDINLVR